MPGTKIPIVEESEIRKYNPDYLYLLSWHIKESAYQNFLKKMAIKVNL
jgi:hypothetical protein